LDFTRRKRKLMKKSLAVLVVLLFLVEGCYYDSMEALNPANGYVSPCDATQAAVYSGAIKTIINYNCLSCHNASYAGGGVLLDSYDQLKKYAVNGKLMNSINRVSNPMPPTTALASCQTDKIKLWITNNYPQ
jgi:cytochrome c5